MFEKFMPHCIKQYLSVNKPPVIISFIREVFLGYCTPRSYWGLSKFAKWVESLGNVHRPSAATHEGWRKWDAENEHKLVCKITESFSQIQKKICYPVYCYRRAKWAIWNYFQGSQLKTTRREDPFQNLWFDDRILYCVFDEFVRYCDDRFGKHPIEAMNKQIAYYSAEESPDYAEHIKEVKRLYLWWKYQFVEDLRWSKDDYYEVESANLKALIDIRGGLW